MRCEDEPDRRAVRKGRNASLIKGELLIQKSNLHRLGVGEKEKEISKFPEPAFGEGVPGKGGRTTAGVLVRGHARASIWSRRPSI